MDEEIFIPITMFIAIALVFYYYLKSRHTERMAIIEKGVDQEQLNFLLKKNTDNGKNTGSFKLGAVLVGVGLALLAAPLAPFRHEGPFIAGLIFVLPGIALLFVYWILGKKKSEETENKPVD